MKVAVLSGKGGTGKTLVSVNLAAVSKDSYYVDCDVEEPNGHLFFKPNITKQQPVTVKRPQFDSEKCVGCRACVDACKFHALAYVADQMMLFDDICHGFGGCVFACQY